MLASTVFLTVMIAVLFALLIPALGKVSRQAKDGQLARHRQCLLFPGSLRLYEGAERYGIISREDLARFVSNAPQGCPVRR